MVATQMLLAVIKHCIGYYLDKDLQTQSLDGDPYSLHRHMYASTCRWLWLVEQLGLWFGYQVLPRFGFIDFVLC
ncbi:unnamed protein product [Absidia cylindrospora]